MILWIIFNPLVWLSISWLIFDMEGLLFILKNRTTWNGPNWPFYKLCPIFVIISIIVSLLMIYYPGDENDAFFFLQFSFMPIPPWGCDTIPGINSRSDIIFLFFYPFVNALLIYLGYPLLYASLSREKSIRTRLRVLSVGMLWLGKGIFESIIIISVLMVFFQR